MTELTKGLSDEPLDPVTCDGIAQSSASSDSEADKRGVVAIGIERDEPIGGTESLLEDVVKLLPRTNAR